MSKEKDRFSRLLSSTLSRETCSPFMPCTSGPSSREGKCAHDVLPESMGFCSTISEVAVMQSWLVERLLCPPSGTSTCSLLFSRCRSVSLLICPGWPLWFLIFFSKSKSWPRKLKLGEMVGLFSFTNLQRGGKKKNYFKNLLLRPEITNIHIILGLTA